MLIILSSETICLDINQKYKEVVLETAKQYKNHLLQYESINQTYHCLSYRK
ncbi:hypothetical protein MHH_c08950 [Mannheimia haemolytica M42548]|nr:hypothetical protein MHH_c08950 [Mannheimia haemolytica M42548]EEY11350.1 hypothetical protein COK_2571 [Mannheimia haemolytica serotype A2 str. BOVINE]